MRPLFGTPGKISSHLQSIGISVSGKTVRRFLKKHDEEESGAPPRVKRLPAHQLRFVRTKGLIRKVREDAFVENPPTQEAMATKFKVSARTIRRILEEDKAKRMKKQKQKKINKFLERVMNALRDRDSLAALYGTELKEILHTAIKDTSTCN